MGVMTGMTGGIFRDVLCNEQSVVSSSPLYATVSRLGSLTFIGFLSFDFYVTVSAVIAGIGIFGSRLIAIRFYINLPRFRFKT